MGRLTIEKVVSIIGRPKVRFSEMAHWFLRFPPGRSDANTSEDPVPPVRPCMRHCLGKSGYLEVRARGSVCMAAQLVGGVAATSDDQRRGGRWLLGA
jgi:hypothetical protein